MSAPVLAVVIPAGGGGTRLWPRSRRHAPKQFLDIVSERTMLQETADRVRALVSPENIFVITNARHVRAVHEQLPETPADNVIGEPVGRDLAPAIGLMAALLEQKLGPDAIMIVLPADHVIPRTERFREILAQAAEAAAAGWLVTLGIPPSGPDTGFGYLQSEKPIEEFPQFEIRKVSQFKEKPNQETAEAYLKTGGYYWNAGMFIASVKTLRDLYRLHLPQMEAGFSAIVHSVGTPQEKEVLAERFPQLEKISIDFGIAEKADKVAVIPADIGWNDVGSWARLAEVLSEEQGGQENIVVGKNTTIDSHGCLIYSPHRMVAAIGLTDMIVIDTPDALLICPKNRSEDVKKVVDELASQGRNELL